MPETYFDIVWPDGVRETCYSPSMAVKDYLIPGQTYRLADFLERSRTALLIASERVKIKYGMPCARALGQIDQIERAGRRFGDLGDVSVAVLTFNP